jgi:hypothetical protein
VLVLVLLIEDRKSSSGSQESCEAPQKYSLRELDGIKRDRDSRSGHPSVSPFHSDRMQKVWIEVRNLECLHPRCEIIRVEGVILWSDRPGTVHGAIDKESEVRWTSGPVHENELGTRGIALKPRTYAASNVRRKKMQ